MIWFYLMIFGSIGVFTRYLILRSSIADWYGFPFGTLMVNVLGCFFIGILFVINSRSTLLSDSVRLALMIGFLGALTTYSSFALDLLKLVEKQEWNLAFCYLVFSNLFGIGGCFLGVWLMRNIILRGA